MAFVLARVVASATQVADQWDQVVVLSHFQSLKGPGFSLVIPIIDTMPYWIATRIDTRVITACNWGDGRVKGADHGIGQGTHQRK